MRLRFKAVAAMATVVGWAIGIVWIVPLMGVFMASIRPFSEIVSGWWNFNEFNPTLSNFVRAWSHSYFPLGRAMLNSFIVSIPSTILPLTVASIAAYGFSRFRFPLKNQLFTILLVLSAIPGQMIALPIFKLYLRVGLLNTFAGLILLHSGVGCIWITFFMKNFFDTLPPEIEDAARVDGASDFVILKSIVLPLSLPALASAGILQFIWVWNCLLYTSPSPRDRG